MKALFTLCKSIFDKDYFFIKKNYQGSSNLIEYKNLNNGTEAFQQLHNGTCAHPKIVLIP